MQLYTVDGAAKADLQGTFDWLAATGFRVIELAGYHRHIPAELRATGGRAGPAFTGIHIPDRGRGIDVGLNGDPVLLAGKLKTFGIDQGIMPMFIPPDSVAPPTDGKSASTCQQRVDGAMTADDSKRNADFLNVTGRALKREGLTFGYYQHNPEFRPLAGGITGFEIIARQTDPASVVLELDAG